MTDLTKQFRNRLGRKEYDRLEDTWLELLEADSAVDDMLGLAELVERYGPAGKARFLLGLLAETLRDKRRHGEQLAVLRALVPLSGDDQNLASQIAETLRQLNPGDELIEKLLQKTGLSYGEPLRSSLKSLDLHLRFRPGTPVFDSELGAGKVERLDLLLDRVVLEFRTGASLSLPVESAQQRLRVGEGGGFLSLLDSDLQSLRAMAADRPDRLVALYLQDTGQRAGVDELRTRLSDVVPEPEWESFWERARKGVAADPHIAVHTRPTRSFQWSESPVEKHQPRTREVGGRRRTAAEAEISTMTPQALARLYGDASGFAQRRRLLERVEAERPADWQTLFARLFTTGRDKRARRHIEERLNRSHPDVWRRLIEDVVTGYRQKPEAFLWVLENRDRVHPEGKAGLVSRALDLLESAVHRVHWTGLRNVLAEDGYAVLRSAFKEQDETETRSMLGRVRKAEGLEHFRKQEISQLAAELFPSIAETEETGHILSTVQGISRAQSELKHLLKVEMPKAADELGRARSQGDLSENYEYKAAKEKQARLVAGIRRLRADLAHARPIVRSEVRTAQVEVGCRVVLADDAGQELGYTLLGPWDSDPDKHIVSYLAPFGKALLGRKPGDSVEFDGRLLTIVRIEAAALD
ncbi:MAG: GreA/GreB family elongation factor [candidate division WOR-3 bacterium]|nr:MAG: GreA/GreB family elongation factor [candidate division WOR-3 bacterium]